MNKQDLLNLTHPCAHGVPVFLQSARDANLVLHYSPKTVYKKAARGEIPSVFISRRKRLFNREAIHYWLANRQTGELE